MFIYKQLDKLLHAELVAKGYKYLWFDGYMNYAPTDTGERVDIRRIVPLKEITIEMRESIELARMLHQSYSPDSSDVLTEALTQDEVYPIDYFNDKLSPEQRSEHAFLENELFAARDESDWYVEVEVEMSEPGRHVRSGAQTTFNGL